MNRLADLFDRAPMDRPPYPRLTRFLCLVSLAAPLVLAGCSNGVLDPKGPIAASNKTILIDSLAIMLAIVVPTILAALVFAWWFRAGNDKAIHLPDWEFSGRIELVVWSIPLMVILLLGGVTWIGSHELDPGKPIESAAEPLEIQVVSLDWKWLFIYPKDNVASVNRLVVPAGVPVQFRLTSSSVMNAFFIPQLGSMIYTMNGMATTLWLRADTPGQYAGMSAMFSGDGFPDMHFPVESMPAERYAAWVGEARSQAARSLDRAAYTDLMKQTIDDAPRTYRDVEPDLFRKIVTLEIPPQPGPSTERQGAGTEGSGHGGHH